MSHTCRHIPEAAHFRAYLGRNVLLERPRVERGADARPKAW